DACLKAAGATWADVVKTNTFVTDYQAFSQCSDVRMRYFGVASPTSTTIQIGGLAQPEAMVEIGVIAGVEETKRKAVAPCPLRGKHGQTRAQSPPWPGRAPRWSAARCGAH